MDDIEGFLGGEHRFKTTVPCDFWCFRPVDFLRFCGPLGDEAGDGFSALGDDDFFPGPDTGQQAGVVITQLTNGGSLHVATLL